MDTLAPDQEAAHMEYEQLKAENERLRAEVTHLRAALHRMRDLGQGMSRSWYVREIEDGLTYPPGSAWPERCEWCSEPATLTEWLDAEGLASWVCERCHRGALVRAP